MDCSRPEGVVLSLLRTPAHLVDTEGCTVRIADMERRDPGLGHLDFGLDSRAAGSLLVWSWALCVLLFQRPHLHDQVQLLCCPERGLLESCARQTWSIVSSEDAIGMPCPAHSVLFILCSAASASALVEKRTNPNPRLLFVSRSLTTTCKASVPGPELRRHHYYSLLHIAELLETVV